MDIFLEHAVSVLSCFVLLFQFCTVYVKGKGIYYFSLYALRIIKYVTSPPCNLINCRKKNGEQLSNYHTLSSLCYFLLQSSIDSA